MAGFPLDTFAFMLSFPHAKINLGLNVVERRPDGYHELQSVMLPIPLHDALEAVVDHDLPMNEVVYTRSGLPVPGDLTEDLCMKAIGSVRGTGALPGLRIHLHKTIPMGAGLGGGSSDGAHMLLLLNELLDVGLGQEELHAMATALGSDCPFFLTRTAQLAEGRGERLRPVAVDLGGLWLVLVNPGIHVGTAEVFRNSTPTGAPRDISGTIAHAPVEEWGRLFPNTLEAWVLQAYPAVAEVKERLNDAGAAYCAMSGSGSTVFGLFKAKPPKMTWPPRYRQWQFRL